MSFPNIEHLAARLRGLVLPGGSYHATAADCAAVAALCAADTPGAHPILACVAALRGLGISIDELCRLCEFELARGPMLGECEFRFQQELQAGAVYRTSAVVTDIVRRSSRTLGVLDRLSFEVRLHDPVRGEIATVTLAWLFPRGAPA